MFAGRYFAPRYFAGRMFPPVSAGELIVQLDVRSLVRVPFASSLDVRALTRVEFIERSLDVRGLVRVPFASSLDVRSLVYLPVEGQLDVRALVGGELRLSLDIRAMTAPGSQRIQLRLSGQLGGIRLHYRFEKRDINNLFVADLTHAFVRNQVTLSLNNDRPVRRQAELTFLPDKGDLDPLRDYVAVFCSLVVDDSITYEWQEGLYALTYPDEDVKPSHTVWKLTGMDLTQRLVRNRLSGGYVVPAGANYLDAARQIIAGAGLRSALPISEHTTRGELSWKPGTTRAQVVNDLLAGAGFYANWAREDGAITSRPMQHGAGRAPDAVFAGGRGGMLAKAAIPRRSDEARIVNQITAISRMPGGETLYATAINDSPDSPISIASLGYVLADTVEYDEVSDEDVLLERAYDVLGGRGSAYRTTTISTKVDPRRRPFEMYEVEALPDIERSRWYVRNYSWPLATGSMMTHELSQEVVL